MKTSKMVFLFSNNKISTNKTMIIVHLSIFFSKSNHFCIMYLQEGSENPWDYHVTNSVVLCERVRLHQSQHNFFFSFTIDHPSLLVLVNLRCMVGVVYSDTIRRTLITYVDHTYYSVHTVVFVNLPSFRASNFVSCCFRASLTPELEHGLTILPTTRHHPK